ncbi:hypothetical protein GOBAR_DD05164 [Gossypium barbadense]|nr:hypothetical protein GOBAR_DD05164 [Gossypium barbadense]
MSQMVIPFSFGLERIPPLGTKVGCCGEDDGIVGSTLEEVYHVGGGYGQRDISRPCLSASPLIGATIHCGLGDIGLDFSMGFKSS